MWSAQTVLHARLSPVYPQPAFPVHALQNQFDSFSLPARRYGDRLAVPRRSQVKAVGLQPKRDLDVSGLSPRSIALVGVPGFVDHIAGPAGVQGYFISVALSGGRTGQDDSVFKGLQIPLPGDTPVFRIRAELPFAGEVDAVDSFYTTCGKRETGRQKNGCQSRYPDIHDERIGYN